mgnify:CR=1 FL=1
MAKVLELTFLTAVETPVKLTVDEPREDITEEQVESVMQRVIESGVFVADDSQLASIKSARIVEREARTILIR